jgi:two-component system, LytTR family, sensor kinase
MERIWSPPRRWIFAVATLLGVFSTLQSYRLSTLTIKEPIDVDLARTLVLNLAYWYAPAGLTSAIFRLAYRFPFESARWMRSLAVHAGAAGTFSIVHMLCMVAVRSLLWPAMPINASVVQRIYLMNLDWALMTYSTIVGLSFALGYYRESQRRALIAAQLETRLVEAQLRTLEAELHPHFLFNTLHAISSLVHSSPDAADRMISRLSDLLRITFDRSGAARIPLKEEVEFLQKYLEIEQIRFQDRLSVSYDIEPDTLDAEVPRLILQPLAENAIKHGVSPRSGAGTVRVSSRRVGDALWLEVRDNGVGLSTGARARLGNGVGLSNTRERLACLYGDAQAIEFSDGTDGLAVRLRLPFQTAAAGARSRVA